MILQVDILKLTKAGLSAHQWVIAELIVLDPKVLDSYIIASPIKTTDVEKLISNKIIEERPLNQDIYLRADLIPTNTWVRRHKSDTWFNEVLARYPQVAIRPNGLPDKLHIGVARARTMYLSKIKSSEQHEAVLKAIDAMVYLAKANNGEAYYKRLPKWITEEGWNDINIEDYGTEPSFGTDLI